MVLKVEEAQKILSLFNRQKEHKVNSRVVELEKIIDEHIIENADMGIEKTTYTIDGSYQEEVSSRLLSDYRKAGWNAYMEDNRFVLAYPSNKTDKNS